MFKPMRNIPKPGDFSSKDVMIVFGELFSRGYANGIVDRAKAMGMKVIFSTVGRRNKDNTLRALNQEELNEKEGPIINVPLEAGFDLEKSKSGRTPVDQLSGVKMSEWENAKLDFKEIEESQMAGTERFRASVKDYMKQLESMLPEDANLLFVHTMAGGFPRAKVVMPAANRVFKGYDDRYFSSEKFWGTDIGKLCDLNFTEVTGETLNHLIDLSSPIRKKYLEKGKNVSYVAYGYHGTESLIGDSYKWQSYSPYLQGWAKIRLENIAKEQFKKGIQVSVFNVPEILTNSSSIFLGLEVALYPLMGALQKEGLSNKNVQNILAECSSLIKSEHSIDEILTFCNRYMSSETIKNSYSFEGWPQHNSPAQMKAMREASTELINMHQDQKDLITARLSEVIFKSCGNIMFNESWKPKEPVWWVGHDLVAKETMA